MYWNNFKNTTPKKSKVYLVYRQVGNSAYVTTSFWTGTCFCLPGVIAWLDVDIPYHLKEM